MVLTPHGTRPSSLATALHDTPSFTNIFRKVDREDPANYRGIISVVGKVFCKILNNKLVQWLDKEGALHER